MSAYLAASEYVDWQHPRILRKARELADACTSEASLVKRSFEFVRDAVRHTGDAGTGPLVLAASDVLASGTGFSFAKSHLLAALLRANRIEAGLCYQRLGLDGSPQRYRLYGLNAVRLGRHGWLRLDARGGRPGAAARFSPPAEFLVHRPQAPGECDLPEIWPEPLPALIEAYRNCDSAAAFAARLPDIEVLASVPAALLD